MRRRVLGVQPPSRVLTRRTLNRLVGAGRAPEAPPWRVVARQRLAAWDESLIEYRGSEDDPIRAYLLEPHQPRAGRPAVLCLHQHAGEFDMGKSEPAGRAGSPDQAYAVELAARGFVTLAPDALCFEDRRDEVLAGAQYERFAFAERVLRGTSLQATYIADSRLAMSLLAAHPTVNARAIGAIGHSLGGQQALFLAAIDRRVRAAVSSCGFASYESFLRGRINHNFAAYVPGLLRHGDTGDILALVAPRSFLALAGDSDRIFPIEGVQASVELARAVYAAQGAERSLVLDIDSGGHAFGQPRRAIAYQFLADHLTTEKARNAAGHRRSTTMSFRSTAPSAGRT